MFGHFRGLTEIRFVGYPIPSLLIRVTLCDGDGIRCTLALTGCWGEVGQGNTHIFGRSSKQTENWVYTYIPHTSTTYTEKQKEHIIHIDDDVNMMRKMCLTSHQFFFFQLSSSLSELHELPTWWSSHALCSAAILKTNSFCLQHHWRAVVTWV